MRITLPVGSQRPMVSNKPRQQGFTLIELLVVMALVAIGSSLVVLSLRDTPQQKLNQEADRLVAVLENAKAQARSRSTPMVWRSDAQGFTLRSLFWITGALAFCISPIADNLTTALLIGAVVLSVGVGNPRFVIVSLINIVVAANAGGAFSPFGDITTLMVWQKGLIPFSGFFALFLPALVNWLVPAAIMSTAVGAGRPAPITDQMKLQPGAFQIIGLFLLTIVATVCVHQFLHLPPVLGMMTGLGALKLYGWTLQRAAIRELTARASAENTALHSVASDNPFEVVSHTGAEHEPFDVFKRLEKAEWDTLMFFYGVILCVGGLGAIGYLEALSQIAYGGFGATKANIAIGLMSAFIDNIPVMFAVLSMQPPMDAGQWLLVTLTAGVGGSEERRVGKEC